jgi:threonine synthase
VKFVSVLGESPPVNFRDALLHGLAPDGGLYIPEHLPKLPKPFQHYQQFSDLPAIGFEVMSLFLEEISPDSLRRIVELAFNFPIPLVKLEENLFLLELFHGPTLAFKDVGARFMAGAVSHCLAADRREVTIAVATSGDTGSAVADGFHNAPGITVYILYPSGNISNLQEQQMTTLGGNVHAVEVEGTFDDCQRMLKQSLQDREVLAKCFLTTANSINLGRLLPQLVYYVWGMAQWRRAGGESVVLPTVVIPSGNLGNLTAACYAKFLGTPIGSLIAATNSNDSMSHYLATGTFDPHASHKTLSNAMDVGNPSNLARLQALYADDVGHMRKDIRAIRVNDNETLEEIRQTYQLTGYVLDPHTAVGVAAARSVLARTPASTPVIVTATAHPAKFPEVIQQAIQLAVPLPAQLREALSRKKQSIRISARYADWKEVLLGEH